MLTLFDWSVVRLQTCTERMGGRPLRRVICTVRRARTAKDAMRRFLRLGMFSAPSGSLIYLFTLIPGSGIHGGEHGDTR